MVWAHCQLSCSARALALPEFSSAAIVMNLSRHQSLSSVHRRTPGHSSSARQAPAAAQACRALPVWLMFLPWNGCDAGGFYSTGMCSVHASIQLSVQSSEHPATASVLALHRSEGRARQIMPGGIPACSTGRRAPAPGSCSTPGWAAAVGTSVHSCKITLGVWATACSSAPLC